jgi:predicted SnoaL-like aldol condensation-catalyzing enzyme
MKMKIKKVLLAVAMIMAVTNPVFGGATEEHNKQLVRDFYELAFNQHKPTEASKKYIGDKYIQHNPHVPNGAEAFYGYFEGYFKKYPESHVVFSFT